jgi:hypothetical protein
LYLAICISFAVKTALRVAGLVPSVWQYAVPCITLLKWKGVEEQVADAKRAQPIQQQWHTFG